MTITAALVVFAVTWFMVFFLTLQIGFKSQADMGSVVPGTPRSAPGVLNLRRKVRITTGLALLISLMIYGIVRSGWITRYNMDVFGIMS